MKIYTCVIIDDEPYAIDALSGYVRTIPSLKLLKAYLEPMEALAELSNGKKIDLILMDIDMPQISGIDLSYQLRAHTQRLVFTTSHTKYGYQAFEAEADAYLLKPFTLSKFALTIARLFPSEHLATETPVNDGFFFAKNRNDQHKLVKVDVKNIIAVESQQNYIMIHTRSGKILTHMTLTEISAILGTYSGFLQFQRSFIIAVDHIDYIYGNTIKMQGGLEVTVGDYYRKAFAAFLASKLLKGKTS